MNIAYLGPLLSFSLPHSRRRLNSKFCHRRLQISGQFGQRITGRCDFLVGGGLFFGCRRYRLCFGSGITTDCFDFPDRAHNLLAACRYFSQRLGNVVNLPGHRLHQLTNLGEAVASLANQFHAVLNVINRIANDAYHVFDIAIV